MRIVCVFVWFLRRESVISFSTEGLYLSGEMTISEQQNRDLNLENINTLVQLCYCLSSETHVSNHPLLSVPKAPSKKKKDEKA